MGLISAVCIANAPASNQRQSGQFEWFVQLVQVLRYALDLFPSEELLEPISQALVAKVRDAEKSTDWRQLAQIGGADRGHVGLLDDS